MATKKITSTRDYRLFKRSDDNRVLDLKKHKKLEQSMKHYGFLSCFPIVCSRNGDKHLIVKDGQHRLAIAETLGLPVHYVEVGASEDFDIAKVNCTSKVWNTKDYALKYAANGHPDYLEGLEFVERYGLPVGVGFAMLAGCAGYGAIRHAFMEGRFKVKDRRWADSVAGVYVPMVDLSRVLDNSRFLAACMAVCRVADFDGKRLLHSAERCRDKLVAYSTRDAYLLMLEEVYNFGRAKLFGLRSAALMAMRDRNAAEVKKRGAAAK